MRKHSSNAFTLIELLVVISIIALLIAILLPALKKARDTAKAVQCGTQQKQIGMVIFLYTGDNDAKLPELSAGSATKPVWVVHNTTYRGWMEQYLGPKTLDNPLITVCPSYRGMWFGWGNYGLSYDWFAYLGPGSWNKRYHYLQELHKPSTTFFMSDVRYDGANTIAASQVMTGAVYSPGGLSSVSNQDYRHNGAMNVLWGDGHVEPVNEKLPTNDHEAPWNLVD